MPLITDESKQLLIKIISRTLLSLLVSYGFCSLMIQIWINIGWFYYADARSLGMVIAFFLLTQIMYVLGKGMNFVYESGPVKPALIVVFAGIVAAVVLIVVAAQILGFWLALGTNPPTD